MIQIASGVCYTCWLPDSGEYGFHGEQGKGSKQTRLDLAGQKGKCEFPHVCGSVYLILKHDSKLRRGLASVILENPAGFDDERELESWLGETYQGNRGLQNFVRAAEYLALRVASLDQ